MMKPTAIDAWRRGWALLASSPSLALPFAGVAGLEALALIFISLGPVRPFSFLFDPPVRAFFGENCLRYPGYALVLPRLFEGAQTAAALFLGPWAQGATVARVHVATNGARPASASSRYAALFMIGLVSFLLVRGGAAAVPPFLRGVRALAGAAGWSPSRSFWGAWVVALNFTVGLMAELFFVYAAPFLLIQGETMESSVEKSFALAWKRRGAALPIVFAPGAAYFLWVFSRIVLTGAGGTSPREAIGLTLATIAAAFLANVAATVSAAAHFLLINPAHRRNTNE